MYLQKKYKTDVDSETPSSFNFFHPIYSSQYYMKELKNLT
jgi:hypothetical protein